ncbi:MAG TPA: histidine phosphatase family protein [Acetobacteraceae bacterium]|nr:histidine phosphatase family protein [Acetobacteraceae bacterium]
MHQLLLLRHAKSSWDDSSLADRARPLNKRGERAAAAIGQAMSELGLAPGLILASPARRSMQTLAALAPFPRQTRIETPESLYLADASRLLATLRALAEREAGVLLIGHNPGLHEFAVMLIGKTRSTADAERLALHFPTAALAEFTTAGRWQDLGPGGGRLVRFLLPRDLPEMAA